ncbi:hypothetical protein MMC10_006660 [Thelotrema lepadinum]|nr:hypothetical protein [Thelotrema lepadinum]
MQPKQAPHFLSLRRTRPSCSWTTKTVALPRIGEAGPRVISNARTTREWAVLRSIPVYHCLVDTKSGAKPDASMKLADRWSVYEEMLRTKPELGDETPELAVAADSKIEKTLMRRPCLVSVLLSDGLEEDLKRRQVRSLIMSGITTSGCVLSTARAATDKGYMVTVVEDACADPVEGLHEMLVKHVLPTTAHVATVQELRDAWE